MNEEDNSPMQVEAAIRSRRSIRHFLPKPLTRAETDLLIEALRWAPSAGNLQSRRFFFVTNDEVKKSVAAASLSQMFIATAPLVVVACADFERIGRYGERGRKLYCVQDVSVAVENMMLQAHELGLGTVWVGAFDENTLKEVLDLPEAIVPMAVIPVGHPAQSPGAPRRFKKEDIVKFI